MKQQLRCSIQPLVMVSSSKNGRQASAFVGLTPKQHSSGGKVFMIGIDKCGGVKELRSLLYLGAMSYIGRLPEKPTTQKDAWLRSIIDRIGFKKLALHWLTRWYEQHGQCYGMRLNTNLFYSLINRK